MKTIQDIPDLKNKKILLRVDFDVPVSVDGQIEESFRIQKQKEAIDDLATKGAHIVMVAHISAVPSFEGLMPQLCRLLGREVQFIKSIAEAGQYLEHYAGPALLDNIRQNPGEEKNDPDFARQLGAGFDYYVNNAFAVCHRNHASVSAIASVLPGYAGPLIVEEIGQLEKIIDAPAAGKVIIIGGAKASTKVPVIKNLIGKSEHVLTGGVVANDILKEKGQDMGSSVVDGDFHALLMSLSLDDSRLSIPKDFIVFDNKILDIGEETMRLYLDIIAGAKLIIWNGPMGLFENPIFAKGTNEIAQAIIASPAFSVIGGGDTISAVDKLGILNKFNFVSTGGGAMLEFLSGKTLPGIAAL